MEMCFLCHKQCAGWWMWETHHFNVTFNFSPFIWKVRTVSSLRATHAGLIFQLVTVILLVHVGAVAAENPDNFTHLSLTPLYSQVSPCPPFVKCVCACVCVCVCLFIHPDDRRSCCHSASANILVPHFEDGDGRQSSQHTHPTHTQTGGSNLSVLTWPSQSASLPWGLHHRLDSICLHQNAISLLRRCSSPLLFFLPLILLFFILPFAPWISLSSSYLTPCLFLSRCHLHSVSHLISSLSRCPFSSLRLDPDISPGLHCQPALCCLSQDDQPSIGETGFYSNFIPFRTIRWFYIF